MKRPKEIEEFAIKSLPILKEYGYMNSRINKWFYLGIIFLWLLSITAFYYAGYHEWFKSSISHVVNLEPEINNTIQNKYQFNPQTNNQYALTLKPNYTKIGRASCRERV